MNFAFPPLTPVVRAALIVLFVSFVAQTVAEPLFHIPVFETLALWPHVSPAVLWQLFSHPLVEYPGTGVAMSRALDLLFLYFWVSSFELEFGSRRTVALLLIGALSGALLSFAVGLLAPGIPIAGAGAMSWAGIGAMCVQTRGRPLNLFLLPSMNGWTFAGVFLLLEALQAFWAHTPIFFTISLGGFLGGVAFTRWTMRPRRGKKSGGHKGKSGGPLRVIRGGAASNNEPPRYLN